MLDQPKKKKPYSKPQIEFFDFQVSTTIASDCEVFSTNFSSSYSCGFINSNGQNVFSMPYISGCDIRGYTDGYTDSVLGMVCRGIWGNEGYPNLWNS